MSLTRLIPCQPHTQAWKLTSPAVDAIALIVQIHLEQNRTDLALKEVNAARKWAQDSLLVNLAESWVGLRLVRGSSRCSKHYFGPETH